MKASRALLALVVVLGLFGLTRTEDGRARAEVASVDRPPVPSLRTGDGGGRTWYCAAGRTAADPPLLHALLLTTVGDRPVDVDVVPYGQDGPLQGTAVTVQPGAVTVLNVGATFGDPTLSTLVSSPSAEVAVEHRLADPAKSLADQEACSTSSSGTWFFPAVTTTRDASAQLTLFNPFAGDAGVDIEVVLDTGVRTPAGLSGIVVPAGSVRVVDLGQTVQRREQFSAVVRARSGRVVAELAQTRNGDLGPRGLRLQRGVPEPARRWAFAGGFTGAGAVEQVVLHNPSDRRATVSVQVTPYGAGEMPPEPIQVEVPRRQAVVVDLSQEARVPGEGFHAVVVDSPEVPVVAARTTTVTDAAPPPADPAILGRPGVTAGLAIDTGTPVAALRWVLAALDLPAPSPVVLVHNPGTGPAVVEVSVLTPAGPRRVGPAELEVPAGDSVGVVVDGAALGDVPSTVALEVRASSPVVVDRLVTFEATELALGDALPVRLPNGPLSRPGP